MSILDKNENRNLSYKMATLSSIRFYLFTATILLILFSLWCYLDRESERHHWQQEEIKNVYIAATGLSSFLYEAIGDLLILADQKELFVGNTSSNNQLAKKFERVMTIRKSYYQIRFIDLHGHEVVRVDYTDGKARRIPDDDLQNKSHRPYFSSTINLSQRDVFVSEFDLNVERGEIEKPIRPVIRFATPVYGPNGNKKGLLIINYLGEKLLRQISLLDNKTKSQLMVFNALGYWLYSPNVSDRWGFQLSSKRNISDSYSIWKTVTTKTSSQFFNDGGLVTHLEVGKLGEVDREWIEKYTPVGKMQLIFAESPWRVISFVDTKLLYYGSIGRFKYITFGLLILLVILIPLSITWGKRRAQALVDEERIRSYLKSLERSQEETNALLQQNRKITQRMFKAHEDERRYIARELHDELGPWLTAIKIDAGIISDLESGKNLQILSCVNGINESTSQIHNVIRGMINTLRPIMLDELGLEDCLRELVTHWMSRNPGIECEFSLACELSDLDGFKDITIYRMIQEGLNNITKYAHASHVAIRLQKEKLKSSTKEQLVLSIEDDGVGIDLTQPSEGWGHYGIRERVASVDGEFSIYSKPGKGTLITAVFPIKQ